MADVGKRVGPTLLTGSAATLYTVPAATTFFLKSVRVTNGSGSDATVTASIGADAAATRGIFAAEVVPAGGSLTLDCWFPMIATEILQAYSGTNGVLVFTAGGVEVT